MSESQKKSWYCPICRQYFDDSDPDLLWGQCPECGSSCTYLGDPERYFLTDAMLRQMSRELALPMVDIEAMEPFAQARKYFRRDDCLRLTAVPLKRLGDVLVVASAEPALLGAWLESRGFERRHRCTVRMVLANVTDVIDMVLRTYG